MDDVECTGDENKLSQCTYIRGISDIGTGLKAGKYYQECDDATYTPCPEDWAVQANPHMFKDAQGTRQCTKNCKNVFTTWRSYSQKK
jgi:hypothetical protein